MTKSITRFFLYGITIICWSAGSAQSITAIELQRLLQSAPSGDIRFQEQRQSPWLAAPVDSRGVVRSLPQGLEKQIESPRRETWRLLPDHLEWQGPAGTTNKQILFSQAPAVAVLSNTMRRVVAGDLLSLERDFRIVLQGDAKSWAAHMQPYTPDVARYLDYLEIQGAGSQLLVLTIVERKGERTTTRFYP